MLLKVSFGIYKLGLQFSKYLYKRLQRPLAFVCVAIEWQTLSSKSDGQTSCALHHIHIHYVRFEGEEGNIKISEKPPLLSPGREVLTSTLTVCDVQQSDKECQNLFIFLPVTTWQFWC